MQALSSLEHRTSHPIVLSAHVPPFMHGFGLHPSFVLQPLPPYPNAQLTVLVVVVATRVVAVLDDVMLDVDDVLNVVVRLVDDVLGVVAVLVLLDVVVDVLLDVDVLVVVEDEAIFVVIVLGKEDEVANGTVLVRGVVRLGAKRGVEATVEDVDSEPSQASPEKPTEQLQLKPNGWSCSNLHLFVMQSDAFVNKSSPFVVVVPWQSDRHSASHESYPTASETARQS